jgi:hypothetical protein
MRTISVNPGEVYGRLTVIRRLDNDKRKRPVFECRCSCGEIRHIGSNSLRTGNTKSCGCFAREVQQTVVLRMHASNERCRPSPREGLVIRYWNSTRGGAVKRGLEFALSYDDVRNLIFEPCYYCGKPPNKERKGIKYLGIDRVDNLKGYTFENCRPACSRCNSAKSTSSEQEFVGWAMRVHAHLEETGRVVVSQR